mmetsp:Transcript_80524/g.130516  ORF Transcript_80524/g.130516 Transcript_80524/m.130516 type:complete len:663 (+) Transcript_80524:2015-4003(+)
MSPEEFKEEEKKAAEIAQNMQEEKLEYDLKDLVEDHLGELKLRARAQARATATAILAVQQLDSNVGEVTEESIEEARIDALTSDLIEIEELHRMRLVIEKKQTFEEDEKTHAAAVAKLQKADASQSKKVLRRLDFEARAAEMMRDISKTNYEHYSQGWSDIETTGKLTRGQFRTEHTSFRKLMMQGRKKLKWYNEYGELNVDVRIEDGYGGFLIPRDQNGETSRELFIGYVNCGYSPQARREFTATHADNRGLSFREVLRRKGYHLEEAKAKTTPKKTAQKRKRNEKEEEEEEEESDDDESLLSVSKDKMGEISEEQKQGRLKRQRKRHGVGFAGGGEDGERKDRVELPCGLIDLDLNEARRDAGNSDNWYMQDTFPPVPSKIQKLPEGTRMYTVGSEGACVVFLGNSPTSTFAGEIKTLDIKTNSEKRHQGEGKACFNKVMDHVFQRCACSKKARDFASPTSIEMIIHGSSESRKWLTKLRDGYVESAKGEIAFKCNDTAKKALYARWYLQDTRIEEMRDHVEEMLGTMSAKERDMCTMKSINESLGSLGYTQDVLESYKGRLQTLLVLEITRLGLDESKDDEVGRGASNSFAHSSLDDTPLLSPDGGGGANDPRVHSSLGDTPLLHPRTRSMTRTDRLEVEDDQASGGADDSLSGEDMSD